MSAEQADREYGRTWDERVERALARGEGPASGKPELRAMLAFQDRRVLAAEVRRLRTHVAILEAAL